MYSLTSPFASSSRYADYPLAAVAAILVGTCASFFLALYWLMQPTVSPNPGLAAYRPPPKTIVRYADAPWVPPAPSDLLPIREAAAPAAEAPKTSVVEEPKKAAKKQEPATTARRTRHPPQPQQNPFWGFSSSRSFGSRPWF